MDDTIIKVKLSVIQWQVILSSCRSVAFREASEIVDNIVAQAEGNDAKGHDEVEISLTVSQINTLISFLQFMPYNVIARIMCVLILAVKRNRKEEQSETDNQETEVEIKVEQAE